MNSSNQTNEAVNEHYSIAEEARGLHLGGDSLIALAPLLPSTGRTRTEYSGRHEINLSHKPAPAAHAQQCRVSMRLFQSIQYSINLSVHLMHSESVLLSEGEYAVEQGKNIIVYFRSLHFSQCTYMLYVSFQNELYAVNVKDGDVMELTEEMFHKYELSQSKTRFPEFHLRLWLTLHTALVFTFL